MATEVILPRVDMDMAEGKIAYWHVKDGDTVSKGQVLFDIETDKATMEVESTASGVIDIVAGELDVTLPVGQVVAWIRAPGEAASEAAKPEPAEPAEQVVAAASPARAEAAPDENAAAAASGTAPAPVREGAATMLRATPLARAQARERGIDLNGVTGSGPQGRIVSADLPRSGTAPKSKGAGAGLHLHWWQRGAGLPVLLLHGFGADHGSWRPLVQQLPSSWPVAGIDLPGHGKSPALEVSSLRDIADAVGRRLDDDGIGRFHLLGHSLGGGVALALASARADRVASLTLLAPAGLGSGINGGFIDGLIAADSEDVLKRCLLDLFHSPSALSGSFLATAWHQLQAPGRQAGLRRLAERLMPGGRQAESLRGLLDGLGMPVKVVAGASDQVIPVTQAFELPAHVALHRLAGVGHLPQIEATALVARLVGEQVRAGTAS